LKTTKLYDGVTFIIKKPQKMEIKHVDNMKEGLLKVPETPKFYSSVRR